MRAFRRFLNLWRLHLLDREFDDELRFHLGSRTDANIRAGLSPREAEAEAHRHLGGVLRAKEGMREARVMTWVQDLGTDARSGTRLLRREPGITVLAVLMLSLGIGTNVVVFSLIQYLLIRPLPLPHSEQLVEVVDTFRGAGDRPLGPTVPELLDLRRSMTTLDTVSFSDIRDMQIDGGREPARALAARVDPTLLRLFGARAQYGRMFADGASSLDRDNVVVLSNGLWRRNFGGDSSIVGQHITINGAPFNVIGVLAADFSLDQMMREPIDLYVPFPMSPAYASRNGDFANVRRVAAFARLKPAHERAAAASELGTFSRTLIATYPNLYRRGCDGQDLGFSIDVRPIREAFVASARPSLTLLAATAGLLTVSIDPLAVTFTVILVVATTIVFGTLPAWRFSSLAPARQLEARRTTTSRSRTRDVLLALEVSIAALLLLCAGLVINSLRQRLNAPTGYSDADVTTMAMRISGTAASLGHTGIAYQRYLERIDPIPGVAVAPIASGPLPGAPGVEFVVDNGVGDAATLSRQQATMLIVSPNYFSVLQIRRLAGRWFSSHDTVGQQPVAIINEELAHRFWPHESALGRRIRTIAGPWSANMMVVGIVGNVHVPSLPSPAVPQIYVSYQQQSEPSVVLMIRSRPGATLSIDAVKQALWSTAPDQPVYGIGSLSELVAQGTIRPRRIAQLLEIFATLALVTSVVGVYTVVAYLVSCRRREVAVRLAIGAHPWDVLALFSKQTLAWTAAGLAVGIGAAVLTSDIFRAAVSGMGELDVPTIVWVIVVYLIVVLAATSVPVMRALHLDPSSVFRAE